MTLIKYDLTGLASVIEVECEHSGRVEPLPSPTALRQRTRDLFDRPRAVAALQRRYGLLPETLREFEIGLELQRRDGPWISVPIRDQEGLLVNVRRRYFGRKPELHETGRKYRNLTGRSEPRVYPAHRLPPEGAALLVCCGEFDALAARQAGLAAVTTTGGVSVWPDLEQLKGHWDVTVTLDRGEEEFAERLASHLRARVVHLPAELPLGADLARLYVERGAAGLRAALDCGRAAP